MSEFVKTSKSNYNNFLTAGYLVGRFSLTGLSVEEYNNIK